MGDTNSRKKTIDTASRKYLIKIAKKKNQPRGTMRRRGVVMDAIERIIKKKKNLILLRLRPSCKYLDKKYSKNTF